MLVKILEAGPYTDYPSLKARKRKVGEIVNFPDDYGRRLVENGQGEKVDLPEPVEEETPAEDTGAEEETESAEAESEQEAESKPVEEETTKRVTRRSRKAGP